MLTRLVALLAIVSLIGWRLPSDLVAEPEAASFHASPAAATEQSHAALWSKFVDRHGVILDFVGELPTPDDCAVRRPNAIGWWSPIEDGPMFTGLYLPAACERARRSGRELDRDQARRLASGLLKCASVSEVPGFIARGVGTDGKCHYPLSSDDQTHPWFYGLHAYLQSGIPTAEERRPIADKVRQVAESLEANSWRCPCDGAFLGQFRGAFQGHLFRDAVRYLFILRALYDVTGNSAWLERYRQRLGERPEGSEHTRIEICAAGFAADRTAIKNLDEHQLWIYVGSQASLARLAEMESNASVSTYYRKGLATNAAAALNVLRRYHEFDNRDTKRFGNSAWRVGYPLWFPQPTQADAERLARTGDPAKLGTRKQYESHFMRNPLAAATIIAMANPATGSNASQRDAIERALCHYDYSRLHMSVFFFAECAYYALPENK